MKTMGFFLVWTVASGCAHWDLDDPAPAVVDVSTPPPIAGQRHAVRGTVENDEMLTITSGILGAIGLRGGRAGLDAWPTWTGEVTFHWGDSNSHEDLLSDGPFAYPTLVFPRNSWALSVGLSPRSLVRSPAPTGSDLYLEVQRMRDYVGLAAGPVWNPTAGRVGAQVTAFLGHIFLRGTVLDSQGALQIGIAAKFPLSLVWSR